MTFNVTANFISDMEMFVQKFSENLIEKLSQELIGDFKK